MKKIISVLLLFAMLISFCACASTESNTETETETESETEKVMTYEETYPKVEAVALPGNETVFRNTELDTVDLGEALNVKENFSVTYGACNKDEMSFSGSGEFYTKERTGEGNYFISMHVTYDTSKTQPTMQFFINKNAKGTSHYVVTVSGNDINVDGDGFNRGGASFTGKSSNYTIRIESYVSAQLFRIYIDDVLIKEVNIPSNGPVLAEDCKISGAVIGDGVKVKIDDIHLGQLPDLAKREYEAVYTADTENLFPTAWNEPADTVYYVGATSLSDEELFTLVTLQGIVNRTTPEIFVDYRNYNKDPNYMNISNETSYLELLEKKGITIIRTTVKELLVMYKDRYDGVIQGTPFRNSYEENVITTLCGVLDCVYMSSSLYEKLSEDIGKEVVLNTKKAFASATDAYMWVWNNYGQYCSKQVLYHMPGNNSKYGYPNELARDYAVMTRAFVFCTDDIKNASDVDFYMDIFASTAPNTGIFGQSGNGLYNEFEFFNVCGQFGKYHIYAFTFPNMSLLSTLKTDGIKLSEPEVPELEADTNYVSFDLSEGDNFSWDYHLWSYLFKDPTKIAETPKGYSICGALYYVAPALYEYICETATSENCVFLDGGGLGNCGSPDCFASMYKAEDREKIIEQYYEITEYVCSNTGISVIRAIADISDDFVTEMSEKCPSVKTVLSSYGQTAYTVGGYGGNYKKAIYMVGNIVRMRCAVSNMLGSVPQQFRTYIKKTTDDNGNSFCEMFIYTNPYLEDFDFLANIVDKLPDNTKIVRVDVLSELYRKSLATETE